jgi:transcriptional regulator with XRE-family HTH domain
MTLGEKIRNHRLQQNLTQKDLADKVNVTAQAVSRWEQDIVEPSIDTLKRMSEIFNITMDDLLSNPTQVKPTQVLPTQPINVQQSINNPIDQRRTIGVCEHCNKPILEGEAIHRHSHRTGRSSSTNLVLCEDCNKIRNEKILAGKWQVTKKKRFWGFFWGLLLASPFVYSSFQGLINGQLDIQSFFIGLLVSFFVFSFLFTYIMDNNFIRGFFWEITSWGFVKLPGVIFSFDIDGLIFLITAKVVLFFIGLGISLIAGSVALLISIGLSGFVMPFALINSFTNPDKTSLD